VQVSATAPTKESKESATSGKVAGVPAVTVWVATPEGARQWSIPRPDREMICGLVGALSVMVRVAVFAPAVEPQGAVTGYASGVNVTVSVQEPPAGTPAVQLLVDVKFPAGFTLAPATARTAGAVPLFAIVTVTGADEVPASAPPKLMAPVGEIVAVACTVMPPTVMICGLCGALSEIITRADRVPGCAGSKVTLMTQVLPAAKGLCEQLSISAKSLGSAPPWADSHRDSSRAGVVEGNGSRDAVGPNGLRRKIQSGGRERYTRRAAVPAESHALRTSRGIIENAQRRAHRARRRRREIHRNGVARAGG
jgi:hypothetical protein